MSQPELAAMQKDTWRELDEGVIPALTARKNVLRADLPPKGKQPSQPSVCE
jgi:hypothetical protein